ncbi:MAG: hypothetical protein K1Y02_21225, partial [Candidatus Hydrogenedentes bacterium]|nr:hypothetical protein [Candidatus Hydrogenedentota bacterium]
ALGIDSRFRWALLFGTFAALVVVALRAKFPYLGDPLAFYWAALEPAAHEAYEVRPIDKSSPVYGLATLLGKDIVQCDGSPQVRANGQMGYRILLRTVTNSFPRTDKPIPTVTHTDLVLFPLTTNVTAELENGIHWERFRVEKEVEAVYAGEGNGYHWFFRGPKYELGAMAQRMDLKYGRDGIALLTDKFLQARSDKARSNVLSLFSRGGDLAVPLLAREINEDRHDCRYDAIGVLAMIPGEQATHVLLDAHTKFDKAEVRKRVVCGIPRQGAKELYLDYLLTQTEGFRSIERVVGICIQFGWREAIPVLETLRRDPQTVYDYVEYCKAIRTLEGKPMPNTIVEAWKLPTREQRKNAILSAGDPEAAVWAAILQATQGNTKSNARPEDGVEIFRELSPDLVSRVLKDLATRTRDHGERNRIEGILRELEM